MLRITPNGTATFSLHYRAEGARHARRLTLGRYPDLSLADARDLAEVKRGEIARGIDPVLARREQKAAQEVAEARVRFREITEEYLKERIPKQENRRKLGIMFNTELLPVLGNMALEDIKRDHVLPICRHIDRRGSPRQARDVFAYARAVLNYSAEKGLLATSTSHGCEVWQTLQAA